MRILFLFTFFTLLLDQVSKWGVVQVLDLKSVHEIDVLPPFVNFRMAWNDGVNFGLGGGGHIAKYILIALALGISAWVFVWVWRERPNRIGMASAGLLIGGALGNVIDRVLYGAVADFLNMSCCGFENPYSFNVADIAIFAGAIGLILFTGGKKGG
ncbi:signal peptidase II [Falsihalocynthiibacter arcticus]|uniref:Lipoprotein signal peptidase n=1 Tax=Falsihalocynthiibacter arcticus TaxID=1579316 RepID=A0A126UXF5_9RHOB|nr:signal peptidase II [Falsihalocynthiibacter arcticus]AML50763.1 lipoprotein signal peptidase [Falsihalocynthiibacter arcticus]